MLSKKPAIRTVVKYLLILLAVGGVAAFFFHDADTPSTAATSPAEQSSPAETAAVSKVDPIKVTVLDIQPTRILDILTLPGETEARHDLTLSAERGGRVEWIGPKEGDNVRDGEILTAIDLTALEAALERAQATFDLARRKTNRRVDLMERDVVAKEDLETAQKDLKVAAGDLREAQVNFRQGQIVCPISGVLDRLYVDPGEYVQPGTPVADIVDVSSIRIYVNVPELDVRYIKKGDVARVNVDAWPETSWDGVVDWVAYKADPNTRTFRVRIVVKNEDLRIRPGMLARVALLRRSIADAVSVPMFSILDKGGERLVFVEENGKAKARTIKIGVIEGDQVQITEGVNPGDKLIVTGHTQVEDNIPVVVQ